MVGCSVGCQAVQDRLGLNEDPVAGSTSSEPEPEPELEPAEAEDDPPRRKRKKKRKKAEPEPPPLPETDLPAALGRAIIRDGDTFRIDPFVLTLVADTLGRGEGLPFTRTSKKERKGGLPNAFRVGELPRPSLWRKLGLKPGDLVLAVQGTKPPGAKGLTMLRQKIPREGTLSVDVQRGDETKTLRYRIEPGLAWTRYLEDEAGRTFDPPPSSKPARPSGGASSSSNSSKSKPSSSPAKPAAVPVTCSRGTCKVPKWYFDSLVGSSSKAKQQMRGKSIGSGYKVTFVGPASRKAGFAVGEVITKINGSRTNNQLAMLGLYSRLKSTKKFRVESTRGGRKRVTTIVVE